MHQLVSGQRVKFPHLTDSFTSVRSARYTQVPEIFVNVLFFVRYSHLFCLIGRYLIRLEIWSHQAFNCKWQHLLSLDSSSFISLFSWLLFNNLTGRTRNHGNYVCSTWGNNHFKTFDGDIYQFPGICEYNFVSDCRETYKEFSVHIQRGLNSNNHPEIQYILLTTQDFTVYLQPKLTVVDGQM